MKISSERPVALVAEKEFSCERPLHWTQIRLFPMSVHFDV